MLRNLQFSAIMCLVNSLIFPTTFCGRHSFYFTEETVLREEKEPALGCEVLCWDLNLVLWFHPMFA